MVAALAVGRGRAGGGGGGGGGVTDGQGGAFLTTSTDLGIGRIATSGDGV